MTPDGAYFKLCGFLVEEPPMDKRVSKEFFVNVLPITIGRMESSKPDILCIDDLDSTLSRQHMKISYDGTKYIATCLSKNGITVDKIRVEKDDVAVLNDGSAIKLGKCRLYFITPSHFTI
jgi:hypothetical protein